MCTVDNHRTYFCLIEIFPSKYSMVVLERWTEEFYDLAESQSNERWLVCGCKRISMDVFDGLTDKKSISDYRDLSSSRNWFQLRFFSHRKTRSSVLVLLSLPLHLNVCVLICSYVHKLVCLRLFARSIDGSSRTIEASQTAYPLHYSLLLTLSRFWSIQLNIDACTPIEMRVNTIVPLVKL